MKIIGIHDGNNGHKSQLIGVICGFSDENIEIIQAEKTILSYLPNFLLKFFLFLLNKKLQNIQEPELIIAIGRKSLPYSIYLKKKFKKSKLVFLMPIGKLSKKYGDLIFYHSYKKGSYNNSKYVPIISAPHILTEEKIKQAVEHWQEEFSVYKRPILSVILGGSAKNIKLTTKAIDDLVDKILEIKNQTNCSLLITASRRTGADNEKYLKSKLQKLIDKKEYFFWGYEENKNRKDAKNPYLAMLGLANYIIVSGESISMISESCFLPEDVGVYIFFSENFYAKRYINFHKNMYINNHCQPAEKFNIKTIRERLNSTVDVIESIKNIL